MRLPFQAISNSSPEKLIMTARQHMVVAGLFPKEVSELFSKSNWTCSRCGVCLPGMMEFDGGHDGSAPSSVICQFCHNLDHAIWASTRGRLTPVLFPEEVLPPTQEDISRLSWMVLACIDDSDEIIEASDGEDDRGLSEIAPVLLDIKQGFIAAHELFLAKFGRSTTAESFLEGVFASLGMNSGKPSLSDDLVSRVRFIPSPVVMPASNLKPSACVSVWNGRKFDDLSDLVRPSVIEGLALLSGSLRIEPLVSILDSFSSQRNSRDQQDEDGGSL